jgi:DNA-directed RNA polymerase
MTFTYGATMYGFTDQIVDYLRQKDLTAKIGESRAQVRNRSRYLAEVVWAALKTSVGSAYSAMAWMRRCASEICKHSNDPIRWHSPLGLPIFMEYYKLKEFQVETILAGKVVKPTVYGSLDQTDGYKSTNGLPANFVHSLDAATLQKTICLAYRRGVRSFGVVHDSFATVPADVGVLGDATREAFVGLYTEFNVVRELAQELQEQHKGPNPLPDPPPLGNFDIAMVLHAPYFFS